VFRDDLLAGKSVLVTGGGSGLGLSMSKKFAALGARVAITGRSAERLAGAAEQIDPSGERVFTHPCDVRDFAQMEAMAAAVAERFGGIDVLVNNASAIYLTGTLDTPIRRFDLMHQVNTRGTFLTTQHCLPHLLRGANPHVLNIAPPLNLNPRWFAPHVAYTMAKYGMSLCVLGMAEEFKAHGVAVNALWPRTAIDTAAISFIADEETRRRRTRQPTIMADAAHAVVTRPSRECTGRFLIDDEVLAEAGVSDLSRYRQDGARDEELMPDFFLD
jgi:citronellol/citronellal dehydrogenase